MSPSTYPLFVGFLFLGGLYVAESEDGPEAFREGVHARRASCAWSECAGSSYAGRYPAVKAGSVLRHGM